MKILTVVGARPQFVKAAVVSHALKNKHTEILVHTGQHFDRNMSETFFEELSIPAPNYNLGISGGSHAQMTGRMMMAIEEVLIKEEPEWVLLYGDTNSTIAAALSAVKLRIKVCHVEAGARFHVMSNPEEINRICTDHISTKLLACTESNMCELQREGLSDRAALVGDPMYDAFCEYSSKTHISNIKLKLLDGDECNVPNSFYYLTCHREENTIKENALKEIFDAMNNLEYYTVYPVHPRNRDRAIRLKNEYGYANILLTEPVGYLESVALVKNAKAVVTDSGGLQREAFFAEKKCVTVLDFVVWPETMVDNRNQLCRPIANELLKCLDNKQSIDKTYLPFGDGNAAKRIVDEIEKS